MARALPNERRGCDRKECGAIASRAIPLLAPDDTLGAAAKNPRRDHVQLWAGIGNRRSQTGVWTAAIVMATDSPSFSRWCLRGWGSASPDTPDASCRSGVHKTRSPARPHWRLEHVTSHRRGRSVQIRRIDAVTIVEDEARGHLRGEDRAELLNGPLSRGMLGGKTGPAKDAVGEVIVGWFALIPSRRNRVYYSSNESAERGRTTAAGEILAFGRPAWQARGRGSTANPGSRGLPGYPRAVGPVVHLLWVHGDGCGEWAGRVGPGAPGTARRGLNGPGDAGDGRH